MGKVTYNFSIVMQEGSLSFLPSIAVGYFDLELNRTVGVHSEMSLLSFLHS